MHEPNTKRAWTRVAFGDVVQLSRERSSDPLADGFERYVGLEHIEPGELKIRSWGDIADGTTFTSVFRPGQVLFGKRRAYQRKVAVADFSGLCSGDIYVLEPSNDKLLPELLPFICQTDRFFEHAIGTSAGSLSPRTNWKSLSEYEFALPPLEEQRRIIGLLEATARSRASLDSLQSSFHSLQMSFAFAQFAACKWQAAELGSLADYASDGPFGSKIKTDHYVESGARVVRLQNVGRGEWSDGDKAFVSFEYYEERLRDYEVRAGDLLIAGLGDDSIPAGRACVVPDHVPPALNKADIFCIRTGERLNPDYLLFYLNSPQGLRQSEQFSQGTTRKRLNLGNIRRMRIPLPPIAVQASIVHRYAALCKAARAISARSSRAGKLRLQVLRNVMEAHE